MVSGLRVQIPCAWTDPFPRTICEPHCLGRGSIAFRSGSYPVVRTVFSLGAVIRYKMGGRSGPLRRERGGRRAESLVPIYLRIARCTTISHPRRRIDLNVDTDKLVDANAAAEMLALKVSTIRRLTYEKRLPCVRPTGRRCVRYRLKDLEALIRECHQPART